MDWLVPMLPWWWMCCPDCAGRQTGCICDRGGGVRFAASLLVEKVGAGVEYLYVCRSLDRSFVSEVWNARPALAVHIRALQSCLVLSYLYIHLAQHVHRHMHTKRNGLDLILRACFVLHTAYKPISSVSSSSMSSSLLFVIEVHRNKLYRTWWLKQRCGYL